MKEKVEKQASDAFNARDLNARQVAERFIAPPQFDRLLSDTHCVLEGPRGSGKTTLLKMLTPEAFALWSKTHAEKTISFIGIFVPADVRWASQVTQRLAPTTPPGTREVIMQNVFSVGIGLALVDTIESCGKLDCSDRLPTVCFAVPRSLESEIVRALALLWRLDVGVASFAGIRLALRQRQHTLGTLALEAASGRPLVDLLQSHPFLGSSWLDNTVTALETLNDMLGRPNQSWAILLDELEIIPRDLLETIVRALRSTSAALRLKISLSPAGTNLIATGEPGAPTPGNDYRSIPLWYEKREDARRFSEKLLHVALSTLGALKEGSADIRTALGPSELIIDDDSEDQEPKERSLDTTQKDVSVGIGRAFDRLFQNDASFRQVLEGKSLTLETLKTKDSDIHGPFVRKITPLVVFRDREISGYDEQSGAAQRRGGNRSSAPYCGYPNFIDIAEGNPRWIQTLAEALNANIVSRATPLSSVGSQARAISSFVSQFVSILRVYPIRAASSNLPWTPYRFVEILGQHLADSLYRRAFLTDPTLSFTIDERSWSRYAEYIRVCIDLGALVIVRSNAPASFAADVRMGSLVGTRVRISYRLAPHFKLPIKHTKEMKMSGPLKASELFEHETSDGNSELTSQTDRLVLMPRQGNLL